jgi:hypothetical protein
MWLLSKIFRPSKSSDPAETSESVLPSKSSEPAESVSPSDSSKIYNLLLDDEIKSNSPILINPSPKVHRIISKDVYTQEYGDCFAFASARVLCKWIRTHNPEIFGNYDILNTIQTLHDRYMDPSLFYNYETKSSNGKVSGFTPYFINSKQYMNTCLFMLFYSKIVKQFGCDGGYEGNSLKYIISQIDTKSNINNFVSDCTIDPIYCQHSKTLLIQNIRTNMIAKHFVMSQEIKNLIFSNYIFRNDKDEDNPNEYFINLRKVKLFFTQFFNIIRKNIKKSNYLTFGCDTILLYSKVQNNNELTNKELLATYKYMKPNDKENRGHVVTIVNYDYSNPKNRQITIKNSWGQHKNMYMNIYESELSSPMLYYLGEYTLLELCWIETKQPYTSSRKIKSVPTHKHQNQTVKYNTY